MRVSVMSRSIYLWYWEIWYYWSIWQIDSIQSCLICVWILPTLDWLYSTRWSLKVLSIHKVKRNVRFVKKNTKHSSIQYTTALGIFIYGTDVTCEIEKDDIIDPFDKSNPFNRVQLVSGYSQPWIGFILKDCPMDNVYSTHWWLKAKCS